MQVERFTGKKLPESRNSEKQNIGRVTLTKSAALFENLGNIGEKFSDEFPA